MNEFFISPLARTRSAFSVMLALGTVLFSSALHAGIGVMDWESGAQCRPSFTASGLVFTNARGTICSDNSTSSAVVSNGTIRSNDVRDLRVVHQYGHAFTPLKIDVGEYSQVVKTVEVAFIGYKTDGTTVTARVPLDGIADGPGGVPDFQTFVFPASFENIVRLEVLSVLWSFDNFFFSTIIPPPLPVEQRLGASFRSIQTVYSKTLLSNEMIVSPDYILNSGFQSPTNTKFLLPDNRQWLSNTVTPYYSRATSTLCFARSSRSELFSYSNGVVTIEATLSDTLAAGWQMQTLLYPRLIGSTLVFMGYDTRGIDKFALFAKTSGMTRTLITPETLLPGPTGALPSTAFWFPDNIAVHAAGFAFDTSLSSQSRIHRLYTASLDGEIRYIVGENDAITVSGINSTVTDLQTYEYNSAGELEVNVMLNHGAALLVYNAAGLRHAIPTMRTVSPVNAGKTVSGNLFPSSQGLVVFLSGGELFRENDGNFFRVLGVGDKIEDQTIVHLELKAVPSLPPARVIVEVRYDSSPSMVHILEIELDVPKSVPPRLGDIVVHPESGEWYLPLSHTKAGKTQWLSRSYDLKSWERLRTVPQISPLQYVIIPPEQRLTTSAFFRIEEE